MYLSTKGLVLRETQYKDNDKLLSVLSEDMGLITVKARGVKNKNSKLRSGCQLLGYSSFALYEKNGYYTVTEAEPMELFSGIRVDIELLSLSSYFSQVLEAVSAEGQANPEVLSLGLNSLYALDRLKKPQKLVKAVFELRLMCLSGFAPMLDGCGCCGGADAELFFVEAGVLSCDVCRGNFGSGERGRLLPGTLAAMRHVAECDKRKLFSFALGGEALEQFASVTEAFMLSQLGQGFSSLGFYKRLFTTI